jgi:hypothetical protein
MPLALWNARVGWNRPLEFTFPHMAGLTNEQLTRLFGIASCLTAPSKFSMLLTKSQGHAVVERYRKVIERQFCFSLCVLIESEGRANDGEFVQPHCDSPVHRRL